MIFDVQKSPKGELTLFGGHQNVLKPGKEYPAFWAALSYELTPEQLAEHGLTKKRFQELCTEGLNKILDRTVVTELNSLKGTWDFDDYNWYLGDPMVRQLYTSGQHNLLTYLLLHTQKAFSFSVTKTIKDFRERRLPTGEVWRWFNTMPRRYIIPNPDSCVRLANVLAASKVQQMPPVSTLDVLSTAFCGDFGLVDTDRLGPFAKAIIARPYDDLTMAQRLHEVRVMSDYIRYGVEDPETIWNTSYARLKERSDRWHVNMASSGTTYNRVWRDRLATWEDPDTGWIVAALTSSHHLAREGSEMTHCVGGYTGQCASGQTRIFSLAGPRVNQRSTLQLSPSKQRADPTSSDPVRWERVQHLGRSNHPPSATAKEVADRFVEHYNTLAKTF